MTIAALLLALCSVALLIGAEFVTRKYKLDPNLTRRVVHIGTALVAAVSPLYVGKDEIVILCGVFILALAWSRSRNVLSSIHSVSRHTYGEVYLPLGIGIAALLLLPESPIAFQFGVLVLGVCDALAGVVGERYGKHVLSIYGNRKTMEGSAAFFLSCLLLMFLFAPGAGIYLLIVPLVLTLIELVCIWGLDNLALPLVAGLLILSLPI